MKYRRLNRKELEIVEQEFVKFLASNHVTASDWEQLKKEGSEKVEGLIGIFSDIVIEQTLEELRYLEFISPKDIKTFYCAQETIHLYGLTIVEGSQVNFLEMTLPNDLSNLIEAKDTTIEIYSAKKAYRPNRSKELFQMM